MYANNSRKRVYTLKQFENLYIKKYWSGKATPHNLTAPINANIDTNEREKKHSFIKRLYRKLKDWFK